MTIDEYYKAVKTAIETRMPGMSIRMEQKPEDEGGIRSGIRISKEGEKASPLLWLDYYHDRYTNGRTLEETIEDILHDWKKFLSTIPDISEPDILDWEKAKHKIYLALVSKDACQPEGTLSRDWLNMKLTVRYCVSLTDKSIQSFHVPGEIAEREWGIPEEELFRTAWENTETLFPPTLKNLNQLISGLLSGDTEEPQEKAVDMIHGNAPLPPSFYVLTNHMKTNGAAAICYQGLLAGLFRRFGSPLYVVPSSIHETIIYPEPEDAKTKQQYCPEEMMKIIYGINRSYLKPKEWLSDSLYYYDGTRLTIVGTGGGTDE